MRAWMRAIHSCPEACSAWSETRDRLDAFTTTQGWVGPNELLLTAGRRPKDGP